jgi:hypothetical protein
MRDSDYPERIGENQCHNIKECQQELLQVWQQAGLSAWQDRGSLQGVRCGGTPNARYI